MNRPSLYAVFGDKKAIDRAVLAASAESTARERNSSGAGTRDAAMKLASVAA